MPEPLSYTAYQRGTYLHHALAAGDSRWTFEIALHYALPIVEDPTEPWLTEYPAEKRVSKEVAQQATEQVRQIEAQTTAKRHEQALLLARTDFLRVAERFSSSSANVPSPRT